MECALCLRKVPLTFHHLIPRKVHGRNFFKKHYAREDLNAGVHVCRKCHSGIHKMYDEMTLAKQFNSLDLLKNDAAISAHVNWVAKQKSAL